jgi:hypothetical protein
MERAFDDDFSRSPSSFQCRTKKGDECKANVEGKIDSNLIRAGRRRWRDREWKVERRVSAR